MSGDWRNTAEGSPEFGRNFIMSLGSAYEVSSCNLEADCWMWSKTAWSGESGELPPGVRGRVAPRSWRRWSVAFFCWLSKAISTGSE